MFCLINMAKHDIICDMFERQKQMSLCRKQEEGKIYEEKSFISFNGCCYDGSDSGSDVCG